MVMGSTATSTVMVRITANSARFRQEMTAMGRSLQMAGGQISKFGTSLSASMTSIATMPAVITTAFGARFIKQTMSVFTDFNDSITRTAGILGEVSSKTEDTSVSFKNLEADIRRIGRTTRFTAVQAAGAAQSLAIAGIAADEMVKDNTIEAMVNFAIAGGIDIQTAVNIGIAAVKAFQLPLSDLTRVSDVLTMTFTKSNTTIVGVGESMKFAAPVMRAAGVEIEETAAAIGALGNAGIRGTIAGTGLRMAINKLLKPTFDARRAIQSLGMNIFVLTAAGEQASAMLQKVDDNLERTQYAAASLKIEVTGLNDALNELSIAQAKNSLVISQIRLRARKEQRALTEEELKDIEKLELANDALNITASKRRIELMATDRAYQKTRRSELALRKESNELEKVVELQTSGITSLADMLHTLDEAGATTAQVLEIFGVRGGTAMSALLSQVGTFDLLKGLAIESEGRTKQLTDTLKSSAYNAVLIFKSAITDLQITMGKPFMEELVKTFEHWDEAIDKNNPEVTKLTVAMGRMDDMIEGVARRFGQLSGVAMQGVIDAAPSILATLDALLMIAPSIARAFFGLVNVFGGVATVFVGISQVIGNALGFIVDIIGGLLLLISGDTPAALAKFGSAFSRVGKILRGFKQIVDGLAKAIAPIIGLVTRFLGLQHAVGEERKRQFDTAAAYGAVAIGTGGYAAAAAPAMGAGGIIAQAATGTMAGFGAGVGGLATLYGGGMVAEQKDQSYVDSEGRTIQYGHMDMAAANPWHDAYYGGADTIIPDEIPAMALGGIVTAPTLALIGEAGPEAIVPLQQYSELIERTKTEETVSKLTDPFDPKMMIRYAMNEPKIPKLQGGGIVSMPTLAVVGETMSEAIVPLDLYSRMVANMTMGAWNRSELVQTNEMLHRDLFEATRENPYYALTVMAPQFRQVLEEVISTWVASQAPEVAEQWGPAVEKLPWLHFREAVTRIRETTENSQGQVENIHHDLLESRRFLLGLLMKPPSPPPPLDILDLRRYITQEPRTPTPGDEPPNPLDLRRYITHEPPGPAPPVDLLDFREAVTRIPTTSTSETVSVSIGDIVIGGGSGISSGEVRAAITKEIPRAIKDALRSNPRGAV